MPLHISIAHTEEEVLNCHPVMAELRPAISRLEFAPLVARLTALTGSRLVYLHDGSIKAVGGYRVAESLSSGRYMEIEDLVVRSDSRSHGYGKRLIDWLLDEACALGCQKVSLASHLSRIGAHRFYVNSGFKHEGKYFSTAVDAGCADVATLRGIRAS